METLILNSTNFLRVTLSQYSKAFSLPATPVAFLVPDVNNPPYSHSIAFPILKLLKWIIP